METNLEIVKEDLEFIKTYIRPLHNPVQFEEVVYQLALFKTKDSRKRQVKIYHPECEFKVGDLIYKEYPGKLPIGTKKFIEPSEGVILKVEELRNRMGLQEILLSYDGTSDFRKYIEYLKRQKIDLLLPHKHSKPPREIEYLSADIDPRSQEAPLIERDFSQLKKKLLTALNKDSEIIFLCNKLMLAKNLKEINADVFIQIKEFLRTQGNSEKTEFLVENFVRVESSSPDFSAYCFSLNHYLFQDHKIDVQQTCEEGWGKWHLISVLFQLKRNALVSEINPLLSTLELKNKKNLFQRRRKLEEQVFSEGENRFYLTQREIDSSALRLHISHADLGDSLELDLIDSANKKRYTVYNYKSDQLLLGLDKIYENYKVIQGTILSLEKDAQEQWVFSIRTTKKGTITDQIEYNSEKKIFRALDEKIASSVFVNKTIFLESEVFRTIETHIDEYRRIKTLNKLFHKIFLEFGIRERNYEIHILRLYHILDCISPIDLKTVEEVVLSNNEFIPSEKIGGVFFLDSDAVMEIEEEEMRRRQQLVEESKRKREELRKQQQEEELKKKDEIRLLREERKRKREDEMRIVESMRHSRRTDAAETPSRARTVASTRVRRAAAGGKTSDLKSEIPSAGAMIPEAMAKPDTSAKKAKKKFDIDKPAKTAKKSQKRLLEEKIELSEIKKEILHEDLIEEKPITKEEQKKAPKKVMEVAYQDQGGFAGLFASKLDEVVEKEKEEKKPKKKEKK